jgi:hypothetical protein
MTCSSPARLRRPPSCSQGPGQRHVTSPSASAPTFWSKTRAPKSGQRGHLPPSPVACSQPGCGPARGCRYRQNPDGDGVHLPPLGRRAEPCSRHLTALNRDSSHPTVRWACEHACTALASSDGGVVSLIPFHPAVVLSGDLSHPAANCRTTMSIAKTMFLQLHMDSTSTQPTTTNPDPPLNSILSRPLGGDLGLPTLTKSSLHPSELTTLNQEEAHEARHTCRPAASAG